MKRTRYSMKKDLCETKQIRYNPCEEPIVFSKYLMGTLLSQGKDYPDLIAVYAFYYYTAKWQGTNQPKSTTGFTAKGTGLSIERVQKAKKKLKKIGLVEDVIVRAKNKITGNYIKLNFIWTSEHAENATKLAYTRDFTQLENTQVRKSTYENCRPPEIPGTNALSSNTKNALSSNNSFVTNFKNEKSPKIKLQERNSKYLSLAKQLSDIIQTQKDGIHTKRQLTQWTNEIRQIEETNKIPYSTIQEVLDWYEKHVGGAFIPVIESGSSLRQKFGKLQNAILRENKPFNTSNTGKPSNAYIEQDWKPRKAAIDY